MSVVDVTTEIVIDRPRSEVAAYVADLDHTTAWYANIRSVDWTTPRPTSVGTRVAFVARFLGRTIAYTYEVRDWLAGERFVMSTADGPFAMETTYAWADAPGGATRMTLRNRGEPTGFAGLGAPVLAAAMRRANEKDLGRLKTILESRQPE
jgi:uncharacterized membrane protein